MNIRNSTISNAIYTKKDQCPRVEFTVNQRTAFISEIREDYLERGFVKLFSFNFDTNWEVLLPITIIRIEDRNVQLMGYTDDERIKVLARKFKDDLDNERFQAGFIPNLKELFSQITQP